MMVSRAFPTPPPTSTRVLMSSKLSYFRTAINSIVVADAIEALKHLLMSSGLSLKYFQES
jgi:hypothetical protein